MALDGLRVPLNIILLPQFLARSHTLTASLHYLVKYKSVNPSTFCEDVTKSLEHDFGLFCTTVSSSDIYKTGSMYLKLNKI